MPPSSSLSSPLTQQQKTIWNLISTGLTVAKVAEKMQATRQYVNQTKIAAEAKLSTTLIEVAQVNDLQVIRLYPKEAILLGYHPTLKRKAIVTYTTSHGLKVWYWHDKPDEVTNKDFLKQTRNYLLEMAKERGIAIEGAEEIHPAKLAHMIFSQLIPELKA
jgi:DNA-binding CsgD family transcriptional regulator